MIIMVTSLHYDLIPNSASSVLPHQQDLLLLTKLAQSINCNISVAYHMHLDLLSVPHNPKCSQLIYMYSFIQMNRTVNSQLICRIDACVSAQ